MNTVTKFFLPAHRQIGDNGIRKFYALDYADVLWHQNINACFVDFALEFEIASSDDAEKNLRIHVTADHRYELYLDGERFSRGPDRCDVEHWSFSSYDLSLSPGSHRLEARVWHVGVHAPIAQCSHAPGFICAAEGAAAAVINTGTAPWTVRSISGITFEKNSDIGGYNATADEMTQDLAGAGGAWTEPVVVRPAQDFENTGVANKGWKFIPSTLPDQIDGHFAGGGIRGLAQVIDFAHQVHAENMDNGACQHWQGLLNTAESVVVVPARTKLAVVWQLDDYVCGYPCVSFAAGAGARIRLDWSESFYDDNKICDGKHGGSYPKGQRDEIAGKYWLGLGDTVIADGAVHDWAPCWWRSGCYIVVHIETFDQALEITSLSINETRYPLENEGNFDSSDEQLQSVIDLSVRGMQMCSHETYMDCPFFEQLMYVGDTRLEMLVTYVMTADDRLVKRCIELFDWSRVNWGFVNERYPANEPQHSPTFSLMWVSLLHDYAYWRDDRQWVQDRLLGMRAMLDQFEPYKNAQGLLEGLPGWCFMDWVPAWDTGNPPGEVGDCSASVNLMYLMALQKAVDLENIAGEIILAQRYHEKAEGVKRALYAAFWCEKRRLFADTLGADSWSEHAQCLALLTDVVTGNQAQSCFEQLVSVPDLHRCTIYFSFYLFEVLQKFERVDILYKKLEFWKNLRAQGFSTPVESSEPSRSDCHAWGSHPLFHMHASIAGIRPSAPSFATVDIQPQLCNLTRLSLRCPHPQGFITMEFDGTQWSIELPSAVTGVFRWNGCVHEIRGGLQTL